MKRIILISFLILGFWTLRSQDFMYQAELPIVDSSGYYHIFLSPDVTSKLNYKFSDLRIFDKKNNEIPYIRLAEDEIYKTAKSRTVKILQNEHKVIKKHTYLLVHNSNMQLINNFDIIVNNPMGAEAWINISGSNNLKNWNILKNNARYMPEFSDSVTAEIRIDDIPETKFEYYRIFIFDYNKTIFEVQKVLNYDIPKREVKFVELDNPSFTQDDSTEANQTILKLFYDNPQYIDKIKFYIKSPDNYLRTAEIVKKDSATGKRIRLQFYDQNQKDFYLCSDSINEILLSRYYAQNLFLIINNNDDKPLQFSKVRAFQREEFLVAYLEKGKNYSVYFGNKNVPPPIYDLKFFKNKIPVICQEIPIKNIILIDEQSKDKSKIKVKAIYLWIAFGVVILILAGISFKMFASKKTDDPKFEL